MTERFDTIVIGAGGAMGSSACLHLAGRAGRVLGIDQFGVAHQRGSSHGLSRMIRMCYFEHPNYVPLLRRAYELWRDLEAQSGERLLFTPGGLYMGREDAETVSGSLRAAREHGLAHQMLTRRDIATRFPQFALPGDFVGLFEPVAGWLAPERAIAAQAAIAVQRGATIRTNERVLEWRPEAKGVRVRTHAGTYEAESLIIAAGAWAGRVVPDLGVPITATRQVVGWFKSHESRLFASGVCPVWAVQEPRESGGEVYYGFPMSGEAALGDAIKVALHEPGPVTDPDHTDWDAHPADELEIRRFVSRFVPGGDGELMSLGVCMYENSPDGHFIIDRHPAHPNVIVAAGFSGHGFKFASVVGEILADLARTGRTPHPIEFLSLARFGRPK